jgi:hypothetical protein
MITFKEFLATLRSLPVLDAVVVEIEGQDVQWLQEGKLVTGRFPDNIRIDQPTHLHGDGQQHAHVNGRMGRELVIVNLDGTSSHGTKGRLHTKDAEALRARGFTIRKDRLVEWTLIGTWPTLLLG